MKKIIIAAALIFTTGVLPSCVKKTPVQTTATLERSTVATKKDVGTAD